MNCNELNIFTVISDEMKRHMTDTERFEELRDYDQALASYYKRQALNELLKVINEKITE